MDATVLQLMLTHLHESIRRMKWRLKLSARNRLAFDITVLCTGLRPMVMIDYGGLMPLLKQQLCILLALLSEGFEIATFLRVMVMEDNAYLIHPHKLQEYIEETLATPLLLKFVILDDGTSRLALPKEEEVVLKHFASFQKQLSCFLIHNTPLLKNKDLQNEAKSQNIGVFEVVYNACSFSDAQGSSQKSNMPLHYTQCKGHPDLGTFVWADKLALPTLNGWLLGYPVIYLFKKDNISRATRSLSSTSLHLFRVLIQSELKIGWAPCGNVPEAETWELMSFTIPSEVSSLGVEEPWVQTFLRCLRQNIQHVPQLWKSLELEITLKTCQAVAL